MNLEPLISVVSKSAPLLASALGSPIAGIALGLIGNLFGADTKDINNVLYKINQDPESAIKLKTLEYQHQEDLQKITADIYSTEVDDRKSARQREIEHEKITGKSDWIIYILACGYMLGFFVYICIGSFYPMCFDKGVFHDLLNVLMLVFSFFFGSAYKMVSR